MDKITWEIIGEIGGELFLIGYIRSLANAQEVGTVDLARQYCYNKSYNFVEIRKKDD